MDALLPSLILIPLVGAAIGAFVPGHFARYWALGTSLTLAVVTLVLVVTFPSVGTLTGTALERTAASVPLSWGGEEGGAFELAAIGFKIHLGVDSIALALVALTAWLTPLAVLSSFPSIRHNETSYYAWILLLLAAMIGVFVSRDALLFYVFFELTLVPMFFLIGLWGGANRRRAAVKFFLYTFVASVFTFAALIYLGVQAGSFDLIEMTAAAQRVDDSLPVFLGLSAKALLLIGLLAGFLVKVPLFPVHTWLPLAHTEAPTAGSVILAGVLLKLGTYGLLRVALPMGILDEDSATGMAAFAPTALKILGTLCLIGIIYGALVAWVQQDIKKLVAYSSVSHLGFCVLGLVAYNAIGVQGSVFYMINHGISTGAMFLVIGMIYDRYHTRDINQLSGLAKVMPKLAFFFVLFVMASIGLPMTNGFISEFLTILGAFTSDVLGITFGVVAATGVVLGAIYMLHMTAKVLLGPLKRPEVHDDEPLPEDINLREQLILVPLAVAVIVLGVFPQPLMEGIRQESELALMPVMAGDPDLSVPAQPVLTLAAPTPTTAAPTR